MLEHLKKDVRGITRCAQKDGLCKHKSGNLSARGTKSGYIVTTSTNTDREMPTPRSMTVMDLNVNILEHISGLRSTSEALAHLIIYRTRKDARATAHIRSMYGITFTLLSKPIPVIIYEVANFGPIKACISVVPYGRPSTMELTDSVVEVCKEAEYSLLEKHGTIAFDTRDIYETYLKANCIGELVQLYYNALTVHQGKEPETFSQGELQHWEHPKEISFVDE